MAVYLSIVFMTFLFHFLSEISRRKTITIIGIILLTFYIIIIQSLRSYSVGVDLTNYMYYFSTWGDYSYSDINTDFLYFVLNKLLIFIGADFRVLLFLVSSLVYIPLAIVAYKYSSLPFVSIFTFISLGFFVFSLSGLRQSIAIGVSLLSYIFIRDKRPVMFLLVVIVSGLFHKSGFLTIILYPLFYRKLSKKTFPFLLTVLLLTYAFRFELFDFFVRFYYQEFTTYDTGAFGFFLGLLLVWLFSTYWFRNQNSNEIVGHLNILYFAIIIQIFASLHPFVMRLGYYFYIYIIFIFADLLTSFKNKQYQSLLTIFLFLFLSFYFLRSLPGSILEVYPFEFLTGII